MVTGPHSEAHRLMRQGRFAEALPFAERALALAPGMADACDALAFVSMMLGQHERANSLYRRATQLSPETPRFWYNLASSERSFGRLLEAESACDRAIGLDATQYPSYLLRSELRPQTERHNHVAELTALLSLPGLSARGRICLGYALAKELDDLQRYDAAFRWFAEAASTRRRGLAYDVAVDERKLQQIAEAFAQPLGGTPPAIAARHGSPASPARYIFIVGLPRSGTTLLERILSNLPGVRSNGETDNFAHALLAASPADGRAVFTRAALADPRRVAAGYAQRAGTGAADECIIEKLPANYLYLGAIQRALPRAKILLVRRSPLDACFAMYRTLFGDAYPFTYDLDDLARYYAAYETLIAHWRSLLGEQLHEIVYEELVSDPGSVGAATARACGLSWNDAAIDVQRNASVSLTASAAQIRRPIYGSSSGRWRHYRSHLEPLIGALQRRGVALPVDV